MVVLKRVIYTVFCGTVEKIWWSFWSLKIT